MPFKLFDFYFESFVFLDLALNKALSDRRFLRKAFGRQDVRVATLVLRAPEIFQLDETFLYQRVENIIRAAETYAYGLSQIPLRHFRVLMKKSQDSEANVFLYLAPPAGHFVMIIP